MQTVQLPLNIQFDTDTTVFHEDGSETSVDKIDSIIMDARCDYKDFAFDVADKVLADLEKKASKGYKLGVLVNSVHFVISILDSLQGTERHELSEEVRKELKKASVELTTSLTNLDLTGYIPH